MYYAEGTHAAIIDMGTYEQAQERLRQISESVAGRAPQKRSVFTSMIKCAKCGASYVRAYNRRAVWQCRTYRIGGRDVCDGKQIPEDILKRLCCEALDMEDFDETAFKSRVVSIQADNDSEGSFLTFFLSGGETIVKRWQTPSRSQSWTPEMKAKAHEAGKRRGGRKDG